MAKNDSSIVPLEMSDLFGSSCQPCDVHLAMIPVTQVCRKYFEELGFSKNVEIKTQTAQMRLIH